MYSDCGSISLDSKGHRATNARREHLQWDLAVAGTILRATKGSPKSALYSE